jgi:peroxiredoxin
MQLKLNLLITLFILSLSCNQRNEKATIIEPDKLLNPKINPKEIQKDFLKWWTYHQSNINLSSNFIASNENSENINQIEFLEKLSSGKFIPIKLQSADSTENHYQLFELNKNADDNIENVIKNASLVELKHSKMVGVSLFDFDFTDLNGNQFTKENTKGKIIILKTWFIKCKACVEEFPELNDFVDRNNSNKNILFISLATDSKEELKKFLIEREFKYNVIPQQKSYITEKLGLEIYPTHIIVDENGNILKVANKASDMISFFEKSSISINKRGIPPPPPPI